MKHVAVGRCAAGKEKTALGSVAVAGAVGSKWSGGVSHASASQFIK